MFFLSESSTTISVAVSGVRGSGKSKLAELLNGYTFTRTEDKRYFRLSLTECTELPALLSDFDFIIFTFDTTSATGSDRDIWNAWRNPAAAITSKYPEDTSRTCLVGTKLDLVAAGSRIEAVLRSYPAMVLYEVGLHYMSTSAVAGVGIHPLALLIANQIFPCPSESSWHISLSDFTGWFLDSFASLFSLPVPPNVNQNTENSYDIPDDNAVDPLYRSPEARAHNKYLSTFIPESAASHVSSGYKITPTLMAKRRNPLEWDNTIYARSHLNIPIPQPRYPHLKCWFVTDFIKGKSLAECWDTLGIWMRFRIACTVRSYISQMRRLTRDFPGSPLGGYVHGYLFSDGFYSGPFKTARSFQVFAEHVILQGWITYYVSNRTLPIPEGRVIKRNYGGPFVLSHLDLSPWNLMLSDDGVLWVIDWASCGFYPRWMEATGARRYEASRLKSWNMFLLLAFGRPSSESQYWQYFYEGANESSEWELPSTYPL